MSPFGGENKKNINPNLRFLFFKLAIASSRIHLQETQKKMKNGTKYKQIGGSNESCLKENQGEIHAVFFYKKHFW